MKTADVLKLKPLDRFLYWIRERHAIYLRRKAGMPKPWTEDEVLRRFFFTNPYRENDRVTVWFRDNIRGPLRDDPAVLMATVIFRWFNLPATAVVLMDDTPATCPPGVRHWEYSGNLLTHWDAKEALYRLSEVRARGETVFTGAYMINSPAGKPKLEAIIERIDAVWQDRGRLLEEITTGRERPARMEWTHECLTRYDGLGGFMAYEIVCDLRYTYLLENAPDKLTWCNPGPGCIRGLYRLAGEDFPKGNNSTSPPRPRDWQDRMKRLLAEVRRRLPGLPPFEMREVEHSLCEYDKYERALAGDGKMKRTYPGE